MSSVHFLLADDIIHGYLFTDIGKTKISAQVSDWLATTFDMGGIIGTIVIGGLSDLLKVRSVLVVVSLVLAAPLVSVAVGTKERCIIEDCLLFQLTFHGF